MPDPTLITLYVSDPLVSARFYARLLGREPVELHPTFAMLVLTPGTMLGLWARHEVAPATTAACGGGELGIIVADRAAVLATRQAWTDLAISIIQEPTQMDFGFTCTGIDPDGNRLRVMALAR